ncbi:helix-turn-helix domain-containing protein [Alteromonas aestuariivivens]|uniref:helix-turn-helix domain-containing protein n=1 Tax=Alteromonas aestuariivivens TaxID=1938339 RepID=UPI0015F2607C|nr:helix-turn-helix domain-containing protein [Alteromonas aestuariivivens]
MPKNTLFLLLACLLYISSSAGASSSSLLPSLFSSGYRWHDVEGMNNQNIRNAVFDEWGTLWIATTNGLATFDGLTLTPISQSDGNAPMGEIRAIHWVNSDAGYAIGLRGIWYFSDGKWQPISDDLTLFPSKYTHQILHPQQASDGSVWFSAEREVVRLSGRQIQRFAINHSRLTNLLVDNSDRIWLAEEQTGSVIRYRYQNGVLQETKQWPELFPTDHTKSIPGISQFVTTPGGDIWLINSLSNSAPLRLSATSKEWQAITLPQVVGRNINFSLLALSEQELLMTSGSEILYSTDGGDTWDRVDPSLHTTSYSMYGNLLRLSADNRLLIIEPTIGVQMYSLPVDQPVHYANKLFQCEDAKGRLHFIGRDNSVWVNTPASEQWNRILPKESGIERPLNVMCATNGTLWVSGSTNNTAAISYRENGEWHPHSFPDFGESIHYQSPREDHQGRFYFGNNYYSSQTFPDARNLIRFTRINGRYVHEYLPISYPKVSRIIPLHDGSLVLGGLQLRHLSALGIKDFPIPSTQNTTWTDDVLKVGDDHFWVARWGGGINIYDQGNWREIDTYNLLGTKKIANLISLNSGEILALTDKGLAQYRHNEWQNLTALNVHGESRATSLHHSSDGSIWVGHFDRKWWAIGGQLDTGDDFHTTRIWPDNDAPQTRLMPIENKNDAAGPLLVEWKGMDLWSQTLSNQLEFSYRLNREPWSPFSTDNSTILRGLQEGEYLLEVRARDGHGNIDSTPASANFEVVPPFYQTRWFTLLMILTPLLIACLFSLLLMQRLQTSRKIAKARMRFLTNISHEIRTPLTLIMGPLEKQVKLAAENSTTHKDLTLALNNANRLYELVEQLLDYRRVRHGKHLIKPQRKDLVAFLKMLIAHFEHLAASRHQRIRLVCNLDQYYCFFDPDTFSKILDNLLINALKYSDEGTEVKVITYLPVVTQSMSQLNPPRIVVEDQGMGIPAENLEQIFDPFYSGNKKLSTNLSSFGVGLALVKELVELHEGKISVISPTGKKNNKPIGTRFELVFSGLMPADSESKMDVFDLTAIQNPDHAETENGESDSTDETLVLLVDDQPELNDFIAAELAGYFNVITAFNGDEGYQLAVQHVPDVVISDVLMPGGIDGLELCSRLKDNPATSHIPVILQTSLASRENQQEGLAMGAIDYLTKPVSIPLLINKINNYLDHRRKLASVVSGGLAHPQPKKKVIEKLPQTKSHLEPSEQKFIDKFQYLVEEKYQDAYFTAESIANEIGMSRSAFYRKFKAIADQSPAEYIKNFRLQKAIVLLSEPDCVINHIAEKIGYTELSPFYRAFKKKYGCTPAEYRKTHLQTESA